MSADNTTAPEDDLPEQLRIRREKRASLIDRGIEPYPVAVSRTKTLKEIRSHYADLAIDVATGDIESLTGRIIFKRDTGKLCFATLREGDGTELQAMLSLDKVGEDSLAAWKSDIDLGDIVSVTGEIITSKRWLSIPTFSLQPRAHDCDHLIFHDNPCACHAWRPCVVVNESAKGRVC